MNWIKKELKNLSCNDKRLKTRAQKVIKQLSSNTSASIPQACAKTSETKAAYRFFNNSRVEHKECVWELFLANNGIESVCKS